MGKTVLEVGGLGTLMDAFSGGAAHPPSVIAETAATAVAR
jgi:hypothetical protein